MLLDNLKKERKMNISPATRAMKVIVPTGIKPREAAKFVANSIISGKKHGIPPEITADIIIDLHRGTGKHAASFSKYM
ncbi:MAG: hypothetical protein A2Y25_05695 [Candidatus Melainabacteria bacterium GWF2_37_15]|nr:MAG: hypothetical protein A2Y25_05695 [Candidatus Melainabacteria bacterium GWF2_37_15]